MTLTVKEYISHRSIDIDIYRRMTLILFLIDVVKTCSWLESRDIYCDGQDGEPRNVATSNRSFIVSSEVETDQEISSILILLQALVQLSGDFKQISKDIQLLHLQNLMKGDVVSRCMRTV